MQRWSDLPENVKREIERKYRAGKSPLDLANDYGLKPKQISDQAYRKGWEQGGKIQTGKSAKKSSKSAKKAVKKTQKLGRR